MLARQRYNLAIAATTFTLACSGDDGGGDNVLPSTSGSSTTAATMTGSETDSTTGGATEFPATYRFTCIDIQKLGDADGTAVQAQVLENQWQADIDSYKLNILTDVLEREDGGGIAIMKIRSGIATNDSDQCSHAETESDEKNATYDPSRVVWEADATEGACSKMSASNAPASGTYELTMASTDLIHIYAQDTDGTGFNCTADSAVPDAVPVRAVHATFTATADESLAAGTLSGCLLETEAEALCSCLGACGGSPHEDCGGCPDGSVPLRAMLGNIGPSQNCTDLLGASAFEIQLGFTAARLPNVPGTCA